MTFLTLFEVQKAFKKHRFDVTWLIRQLLNFDRKQLGGSTNKLIKNIRIDVFFRNKHGKLCEIMRFLLKAHEVPMKNPQKATYANEIES